MRRRVNIQEVSTGLRIFRVVVAVQGHIGPELVFGLECDADFLDTIVQHGKSPQEQRALADMLCARMLEITNHPSATVPKWARKSILDQFMHLLAYRLVEDLKLARNRTCNSNSENESLREENEELQQKIKHLSAAIRFLKTTIGNFEGLLRAHRETIRAYPAHSESDSMTSRLERISGVKVAYETLNGKIIIILSDPSAANELPETVKEGYILDQDLSNPYKQVKIPCLVV